MERRRFHLPSLALLFGIASMGAALALYATAGHGISVVTDSVKYLAAARSLAGGQGLTHYDGSPYVLWPPLYPATLAVLEATEGSALRGARVLHALLFGAVVLASGLLFRRLLRTDAAALAGAAAVVAGFPLFRSAITLYSEIGFVLLLVLFLLALHAALASRGAGFWLLAGALAALATLQRYAGLTLVATGALALVAAPGQGTPGRRVLHSTLFGLLATAPLALYALRNWLVGGALFGERPAGGRTLARDALDIADTLLAWTPAWRGFAPEDRAPVLLAAVTVLLLLAITSVLAGRSDAQRRKDVASRASVLLLFVAAYVAFLLATSSLSLYGRLGHRLLSPLFVPATALALLALEGAGVPLGKLLRSRYAPAAVPVVVVALWIALHLGGRMESLIANARRGGLPGFGAVGWTRSEAVAWLRDHPLQGSVYTNVPDALYMLLGLDDGRQVFSERVHPFKRDRTPIVDEEGWIVWFTAHLGRSPLPRGEFSDFERIDSSVRVTPVRTFSDGALYRVDAGH